MQSTIICKDSISKGELKQLKVDNWGTFFLRRLIQLYFKQNLLDLDIKFETTDNVLRVHKLVVTTCTNYFLQLDRVQNGNCTSNRNAITVPSDMSFECVKSIIGFIYTGQLEYWTSDQSSLYYAAQKMDISILTKLLDAQSDMDILSLDTMGDRLHAPSKLSAFKNIIPAESMRHRNTEQKLSVWEKKLHNLEDAIIMGNSVGSLDVATLNEHCTRNTDGPSRFDLPGVEELTLGVFSSFDDITYDTKPIVQAHDEAQSSGVASEIDCYKAEIRNQNCPDNDVESLRQNDNLDDDWMDVEPFTNPQTFPLQPSQSNVKDVRNWNESNVNNANPQKDIFKNSNGNHAKIVKEVLKKYPHLVKHNKNIRLKIMHKEHKNSECSVPGKIKVSYELLSSDSLIPSGFTKYDPTKRKRDYVTGNSEVGPWKCIHCNLNENYTNYNMYRRHLQDVHGEKFDPRVCEYCGYKASKRNILMFHLYTKHNILPPKNIVFPRCRICSHVALSEALLMRHQINHKHHSSVVNVGDSELDLVEGIDRGNDQSTLKFNSSERMNPHILLSNDVQEENYHLICDQPHMVNLNNLVHVHENNIRFGNSSVKHCEHEIQSMKELANPIQDQANEIQQSELDSESIEITSSIPEKLRMKFLVDQNCHVQNPEKVMEVSIIGDIAVQNSGSNMIIYIEDGRNSSTSASLPNIDEYSEHLRKNAGMIEEVVEELLAVNSRDEVSSSYCRLSKNEKMLCMEGIDRHSTDTSIGTLISDIDSNSEQIQYVEEETEILEYETCTNV